MSQRNFAPSQMIKIGANAHRTGVKPRRLVNIEGQNHKVKRMNTEPQLHFKIGARTSKNQYKSVCQQ
jgi:hypothetical protein